MTEFAISLIRWGGYWGIAILMCLENVVPPIPSEVIMGLGGLAVARGDMAIVPLMIAGTAGTVVGNLAWYEAGRRLGYRRLRPLVDRWGRWLTLHWSDIERLNDHFRRRGAMTVFVFRFLPTFRTMISLPAGLLEMPRLKFLFYTTLGSAIWNGFLAGAGYYLGRNFREIDQVLNPLAIVFIALVGGWYIWRVIRWEPETQDD
ncbi:DedA family protein [Stakelama tenebrarum]|uniref:DedA family protein n=1 Tax=Stakelama tenebrarum TaxID=2711215 RepID=A0A6G6Y2Z5_9SPHN|nr:DedA family protein [Sphingosinithalassobacter tenebrarum]QIG79270.1 DedA family protein [Sphingosinithalassobacter tenebrarum]